MAQFSTAEPRSVCLSVSKKNQDAKTAEKGLKADMQKLHNSIANVMEEESELVEKLLSANQLAKRTQTELKEMRAERLQLEARLRGLHHKAHMMTPKRRPRPAPMPKLALSPT